MPTGETLGTSRSTRSTTHSIDISKSTGEGDVAEVKRDKVAQDVRSQFDDIFQVGDIKCNVFDEKELDSVEECNVAGRLSRPESIKFFESIGAPLFILNILKFGHFSKFKSFVPPLERKNNGSFYKHETWVR